MKPIFKFIFTFLAAITVSGIVYANSFETTQEIESTYVDSLECKYDQCHAIAKSTEKRCKHCVSNEGDLYCWQHD